MIDQIRNQQLYAQAAAVRALPTQQTATYQTRDPVTGQRLLTSADGSTIRATYSLDYEPQSVPLIVPGRLGIPGVIR